MVPLRSGFTKFHGVIINTYEARHFRYLERRLRAAINRRNPLMTHSELVRLKEFAGDADYKRTIFEIIRRDADARWRAKFRSTWRAEVEALRGVDD